MMALFVHASRILPVGYLCGMMLITRTISLKQQCCHAQSRLALGHQSPPSSKEMKLRHGHGSPPPFQRMMIKPRVQNQWERINGGTSTD
jgi:hypothetical protein